MKFRDLEKVREIIKEATGLDLTYAYDDLVFPENVAFIIQFDDDNESNFFCHFHEESNEEDRKQIFNALTTVCNQKECTIEQKELFTLKQKGEEVEIHFLK